jgi:hypothetical protein
MRLRILNPCPVDFNAMREDGEARYCDKCNKHVYDLTCMSGDEVRAFVSRRGRICGRVAAAALALTGCSAADQTAQTTVQIGPLTAPPPKPDAGAVVDDQPLMGEIEIQH